MEKEATEVAHALQTASHMYTHIIHAYIRIRSKWNDEPKCSELSHGLKEPLAEPNL